MTNSTVFPGYNLRGLIMTYLEANGGWVWDKTAESWNRDGVTYDGPFATDNAIHHQIEEEEGRA